MSWLSKLPAPVAVTYEAGPTGFGLARDLTTAGVRCQIAAPSKIRRAPGDRVKTDGRDALLLARLLRMDDLTVVRVPSVEQEAARDLVRAREDCRGDLTRARHRLSKLLLRHGLVWDGTNAWTGAHDTWLRRLRADNGWSAGTRSTFDAGYETVVATRARRDRLDTQIAEMAADSEFTPIVRRLGCLRGISTLTGFALAVEIGDWTRFSGASIGAFVGLTPSEHSSGSSRSLGSITTTGNGHARRLLVEAAWHHRKSYRNPSTVMQTRWDQASPAARARGHAGNHRLHRRWEQLLDRRKKTVIANVAVARELAGWCWSLAVMDD
jgi:transposase